MNARQVEKYKDSLTQLYIGDAKRLYDAFKSSSLPVDFDQEIAASKSNDRLGLKFEGVKNEVQFSPLVVRDSMDAKMKHLISFWNKKPTVHFNKCLQSVYHESLMDVMLDYVKYELSNNSRKESLFAIVKMIAEKKNKISSLKRDDSFNAIADQIIEETQKEGDVGKQFHSLVETLKESARFYLTLHTKATMETLSYFSWTVFGRDLKDNQLVLSDITNEALLAKGQKLMSEEKANNFEILQYTLFYQLSLIWLISLSHVKKGSEEAAQNKWLRNFQLPSMVKLFRSNPLLNDVRMDEQKANQFFQSLAEKCREFMEDPFTDRLFDLLDVPSSSESAEDLLKKCHEVYKMRDWSIFDLIGWDLFSVKEHKKDGVKTLIKKDKSGTLWREVQAQMEKGEVDETQYYVPSMSEGKGGFGDNRLDDDDERKGIDALKTFIKEKYPQYQDWTEGQKDAFDFLTKLFKDKKYTSALSAYKEYVSKYDFIRIQEHADKNDKVSPEDTYYANVSKVVFSKFKVNNSSQLLKNIKSNWNIVYTTNVKKRLVPKEDQKLIDNIQNILFPYVRYDNFGQTSDEIGADEVIGYYVQEFHQKFARYYTNGLLYRYFWAQIFIDLVRDWKALRGKETEQKNIALLNVKMSGLLSNFNALGNEVDPFQIYQLYYRRKRNELMSDPIFKKIAEEKGFTVSEMSEFFASKELSASEISLIDSPAISTFSGSAIRNVLALSFSVDGDLETVEEKEIPFKDPETTSFENDEAKASNAKALFSYLVKAKPLAVGSYLYQALEQAFKAIHGDERVDLTIDESVALSIKKKMGAIGAKLPYTMPDEAVVFDYSLDYLIAESARNGKDINQIKELFTDDKDKKGKTTSPMWSRSYERYFKKKTEFDFGSMIQPYLSLRERLDEVDAMNVDSNPLSKVFWSAVSQSEYIQLLFLASPILSREYEKYSADFTNAIKSMIANADLSYSQLFGLSKLEIYFQLYGSLRERGLNGLNAFKEEEDDKVSMAFSGSKFSKKDFNDEQLQVLSHLEAIATLSWMLDMDTSLNCSREYRSINNIAGDPVGNISLDDVALAMKYAFSPDKLASKRDIYEVMVVALSNCPQLSEKITEIERGLSSTEKDKMKLAKAFALKTEHRAYNDKNYLFAKAIACYHPFNRSELDIIFPGSSDLKSTVEFEPSKNRFVFSNDVEVKGSAANNKSKGSTELPGRVLTTWSDLGLLIDTREYFNTLYLAFVSYNCHKTSNSGFNAGNSNVFDIRVFRERPGLQRAFFLTKVSRKASKSNSVSEKSRDDITRTIDSIYGDNINFSDEVMYGYYVIEPTYQEVTVERSVDFRTESRGGAVNKYDADFESILPMLKGVTDVNPLTRMVTEELRKKYVDEFNSPFLSFHYHPESCIRLWTKEELDWSTGGVGRKNYSVAPIQEFRKRFYKQSGELLIREKLKKFFYVPSNCDIIEPDSQNANRDPDKGVYEWTINNVLKAVSDIRSALEAIDKASGSKNEKELSASTPLLTASVVSLIVVLLETWNPNISIQLIDEMIKFSQVNARGKREHKFAQLFFEIDKKLAQKFTGDRMKKHAIELRHFSPESLLKYLGVTKGRLVKLADKRAGINARNLEFERIEHTAFEQEYVMQTVIGLKHTIVIELNRFMAVCLKSIEVHQDSSPYKGKIEFLETVAKATKKTKKSSQQPNPTTEDAVAKGGEYKTEEKKKQEPKDSVSKIKTIEYGLGKQDDGMFGLHVLNRTRWGDASAYYAFNSVTIDVAKITTHALRLVDMAVECGIYDEKTLVEVKKDKKKKDEAMQIN